MLVATGLNVTLLLECLMYRAIWSASGIGRFQFTMDILGVAFGGHVRTGLEADLQIDTSKSEMASNEALVRRIVDFAHSIGRPMASHAENRKIMGVVT